MLLARGFDRSQEGRSVFERLKTNSEHGNTYQRDEFRIANIFFSPADTRSSFVRDEANARAYVYGNAYHVQGYIDDRGTVETEGDSSVSNRIVPRKGTRVCLQRSRSETEKGARSSKYRYRVATDGRRQAEDISKDCSRVRARVHAFLHLPILLIIERLH